MATSDQTFAGPIPEIYDRLLVPLIFESYARDLAERLAKTNPNHVLETAAGTGVLTRAMASVLPAPASLTATDFNEAMLERTRTRQGGDGRIRWQQADATALPFADQSFDAVACQFGVMFFPDRVKGFKEALRVLKSGGRFFFNVWDKISENEFGETVTDALSAIFPADPPRFFVRTPHGYHDQAQIRAELTSAGFSDIAIEGIDATSRASSPLEAAIAYCQGTPLRNEIESRDASGLQEATRRAAEALARRVGDGPIAGRIRAYVISAA
jgi:ubiquinone/menaquinone biosynthesis C-methylase UbiE